MRRRPQGITEQDWHVIRSCVEMIVADGFIVDAAFHSRLGVDRDKARQHLAHGVTLPIEDELLLIRNSLNEACTGIRISDEDWDARFTFSRDHACYVFERWTELHR